MTISAPSWVQPGTYLENLEVLEAQRKVASVELLFYIYDEDTRSIFARERERIAAKTDRFGFTVHLPDPLLPEHEALVEATRDFVRSYVFHPAEPEGAPRLARTVAAWRERYGDIFLLENTRLRLFEANLPLHGDIGLCCDVGHLLLEGVDPAAWLDERAPRVRELHLHGIAEGKDHAAFSFRDPSMSPLVPFLRIFDGTVEIEVFSLDELGLCIAELESACGA
jgi:hypothetical protein